MSWFETVFGVVPTYRDDRLASFSWGSFSLLLDAGDVDSAMTLGFASVDCDKDFHDVVAKGAVAIESADRPWGARAAYVRGPGALTVEFEQLAKRSR